VPNKKQKWRCLPLGKWEPLLNSEHTLHGVSAVFPAGVFLKIASNANNFHVELVLEAPGLQDPFSVVVPPSGAIYDLNLLAAPNKNAPRSEEWCNMFGIITRDNLSKGIIERRENGTLVVFRTFRHNRDQLTPFGLYFTKDTLRVSESDYMVITNQNFEDLLANSSGADASYVPMPTACDAFTTTPTLSQYNFAQVYSHHGKTPFGSGPKQNRRRRYHPATCGYHQPCGTFGTSTPYQY